MLANEPCPNCGSLEVRWRRRRIYDVVFTQLRYAVDSVLGMFFGKNRSYVAGGAYSERADEERLDALRYRTERKIYENRVGTTTAAQFWKCPLCRQKGEVFEDPTELITGRAHLIDLENAISSNLGAVSDPIAEQKAPGE